ncbi:hypothetical protein F4803DRAFT_448178 [Xylaria telfairii]|nr:hypothetical protein F4803DRAFT_448178 [Xylaria telfairii]
MSHVLCIMYHVLACGTALYLCCLYCPPSSSTTHNTHYRCSSGTLLRHGLYLSGLYRMYRMCWKWVLSVYCLPVRWAGCLLDASYPCPAGD